jgi:hypothetical protein
LGGSGDRVEEKLEGKNGDEFWEFLKFWKFL